MQKITNYFQFLICCFLLAFCSLAIAQPGSTTFVYTGAVQTFTVPCTDTITVKAWAGGGSGGGADSFGGAVGGAGACVVSTFVVTPGEILTLIVGGGAGSGGNHVACIGGGVAGWGNGVINGGTGGGAGCSGTSGGGGGGGAGSGVYNGATVWLVAGGGGGGSGGGDHSSGATGGGGDVDGNPAPGSCSTPGLTGANTNGNGTIGLNKGGGDGGGGGAGGGGYLGGTGGGVATGCDCGACGGGGGSSYASPTGLNTTISNGNGQTPGNSTDPALPAGVAVGGGTSTAGGNGIIVISYNLDPAPTANFSSSSVCFNSNPTQFTDLSTSATSWLWNFGDPTSASNTSAIANPTHTYTAAGNFTATLTVTNALGCTNTTTPLTVTVNAAPAISFTSIPVCQNNPSAFTDLSTLNAAPITNWIWNFGEPASGINNISLIQDPSHTYGSAGTFHVSLYSISPAGCKDSLTKTVVVNPLPLAKALAPPVCFPDPVFFTDQSTIALGQITKWSWNFDDPGSGANNISTNQDTAHLYSLPGIFNVLLTVTSDSGCQSTTTVPVTVNPKPAALFTVTNACTKRPLSFNDASTVATGAIASYTWNFGDGSALGTTASPNHTYADSGTYLVTLIVTSSGSCKDTLTANATSFPLPLPNLSFVDTAECLGIPVTFTNQSAIPLPATITAWNWNFGDPTSVSNTSTLQSPTHIYTAPGTYNITLTDTTNNKCIAKFFGKAIVYPLPKVAFSPTNTCQGIGENFVDQSSVTGGSIAGQIWLYSDGTFDTIPNPVHIFTAPGQDSVKLYVITNNFCIDSLTKPLTVNPVPVAAFTPSSLSGCQNAYCPTFTDNSTILSGTIKHWAWSFGDGTTSTSQSPTRCYTDTGIFSIKVILTSDSGCTDTLNRANLVQVFPTPIAAFTTWQSVETIIDPTVKFTNASSADVTKWFWYFGDGDSINPAEINPVHSYPNTTNPEVYKALLLVINSNGCTDTVSHNIIMGYDWTFYIPSAFTPNGDGKNETFGPKGINLINYSMDIFDRWGNLIFMTQDLTIGWDGTANQGSQVAQQDVYVWKISFTDIFNKAHNEVGQVTLVR